MGNKLTKSKDKRRKNKEMTDSDTEDRAQDYLEERDDTEEEEEEGKLSDSVTVTGKICSKVIGGITVSVVEGDIATQRVDVVVCSSTGSLNLEQGAIAKAISKQAGARLQSECREKYPEGIKAGDVAITGPGNLPCKKVFHVCLPKFRGDQTRKILRNALYKCLSNASQSNYRTIAFPALGTGRLGYHRTVVAKAVSSAVKYLHHKHSDSSVKEVICVIHPTNRPLVQAFTKSFKELPTDTTAGKVAGVHIGNISVKLIVGKLTEQECDVIVGTSTRKMELSKGGLSKAILEAAGDALQTECSLKYPQGIKHGEVAKVLPHRLACSNIYLGALPRYDRPPEDSDKTPRECLDELMTNCLQQAFKDKRASLCFPPFGSGFLRFPPEVSATAMLEAIRDFNTNNSGVTMTVYIVLQPEKSNLQKNLKPFEKALKDFKAGLGSPRGAQSAPERYTPDFCRYMYLSTDHRPPPYWTHFTDMKPIKDWKTDQHEQGGYQLVDVDKGTFLIVESLVMNTWEQEKVGHGRDARNLSSLNFTGVKITQIQRVENLTLYEGYVHKRALLFHKASSRGEVFDSLDDLDDLEEGGLKTADCLDESWSERLYDEVNEGYFFHGTKADKVDNLLKQGIDVRMAQGGAVFGQGIYMAESSTKADQYVDVRDQRQRTGLQMFLVRASLGEICVMKKTQKLRRPPCKEEDCGADDCSHENRYDSVVEEGKFIFREFVLYDTHQAYPEYIITYDRV